MASEPVPIREIVRFGDDFELEPRLCELRRGGRVLKLERIPMELLLLLVEQRGGLVTREQIVERIWGKGVFLDTDNSINGAIRKIRQVLKDDPEQPRFIQTLTGKGYRFIAPVAEPGAAPVTIAEPAVGVEPLPGRPTTRRWPLLIGIAVAFVAVGAVAGFYWSRTRTRPQPSSGRLMLAVLPFENLTGDAGQDYFSDGFTEEMVTQLGRLEPQRLGVIARTSVMRYKKGATPLDQVGRELGVQYILEGSVRRDARRVRITAQLIHVKDQTHLWAREYDRELKDLLVLQGEIAEEISTEIQAALGDHKPITPVRQPSLSPKAYEAYDLYLKGRYFWNKRTPAGFQRAIELFEQATSKDPTYARAYAGLADSYAMMSIYGLVSATAYMPKARAAALKALQIEDSLAEAHTSLALIVENYDWDWQTAENEYRRAIELDPNYATAHHWYAECLAFQGRFGEASTEVERARQLDPLSLIIAADKGAMLYFSRQYDRAIEQLRAVLAKEPGFPRAHLIVFAYVEKGRFADALAEIQNWRRFDDTPAPLAVEAYVYGRWGRQAEAQLALEKLRQANRRWHLDPAPMLAIAYAGSSEKDKTLAALEDACLKHSNALTVLKVEPIYDPLRSDPRFQELLRHVGLAR